MVAKQAAILLALFVLPAAAWTESRVAPGTNSQYNPAFSVGENGTAYVLWDEFLYTGYMNQRVYYASGDGKTWSAPEMPLDAKIDQLAGGVGAIGGGLLAAVDQYTMENEKTTGYLVRRGGAWKSVGTDKDLCSFSVASGKAYKAWVSGGALYAASSADAVSWSAPVRIAETANCTKVFFGDKASYAAYVNGTDLMVSGSGSPGFQRASRFVLSFSGFVDAGGALNALVAHTNADTDYVVVAGRNVSTYPLADYLSTGGLALEDENGTRHAVLFSVGGGLQYVWSKNLRNWFTGERPTVPTGYDQVSFGEKSGTLYLLWTDSRFGNSQVFLSTQPVSTETIATLSTELYASEQQALFGSNVTLYLTVRNTGTEDVAGNVRVALYVDGNETRNFTISGLGIGASYSAAVVIPLASEGNVTVRAVADPDGLIRRSGGTGNAAEVFLEVLKAGCARDAECAYGQYCSGGKCTECTSCSVAACSDYLSCRKPIPPAQRAQAGDNTMTMILIALAGAAAGVLLFLWRRRK